MTVLSRSQVIALAQAAGVPTGQLDTAAAIAKAESGYSTTAVDHDSNGTTDTGLWQINSVHGYSQTSLYDPNTNAAAMFKISNGGTNWSPWTTYTSGAYKKYLEGNTGVTNPTVNATSSVSPIGSGVIASIGATTWISKLGGLLSELTSLSFWERFGMAIGGVVLVILGFTLFASQTKAGKAAAGLAVKAAAL